MEVVVGRIGATGRAETLAVDLRHAPGDRQVIFDNVAVPVYYPMLFAAHKFSPTIVALPLTAVLRTITSGLVSESRVGRKRERETLIQRFIERADKSAASCEIVWRLCRRHSDVDSRVVLRAHACRSVHPLRAGSRWKIRRAYCR